MFFCTRVFRLRADIAFILSGWDERTTSACLYENPSSHLRGGGGGCHLNLSAAIFCTASRR